ncbi:A/G-specific adenine glycosylase [Lacibacterium aquatile]|uniref:Adenine DNA glycosylase n=1 Tax=Lacibacterium aquatile TaxID=1168082 RepID=A0ABW5DQL2_9PROT
MSADNRAWTAAYPAARHAELLLDWYDRHRRRLPWRALPGEQADPYRVWLSEVMLQQTTVQTVASYFVDFTTRWPKVGDLAAAPLDDLLARWAGLGYYARARNLHKCAQAVVARHGGVFPSDPEALRALPGIGDYTAAAIASIAFDVSAAVMDGNVERVIARLFTVEDPLPKSKPALKALTEMLTPLKRPGDYAQAMMDLGATICTPKRPACGLCPVRGHCAAWVAGTMERYPLKAPKADKPTRHGVCYVLMRKDGAVLLRKRPESGLLGGMLEFPGTVWTESAPTVEAIAAAAPIKADWRDLATGIRHTFTHFHLELSIRVAQVGLGYPKLGRWVAFEKLGDVELPTLFAKVAKRVLKG